jgi:hypothetical protein
MAAPSEATSKLSVSACLTSRQRVAPSAPRMASSPSAAVYPAFVFYKPALAARRGGSGAEWVTDRRFCLVSRHFFATRYQSDKSDDQ